MYGPKLYFNSSNVGEVIVMWRHDEQGVMLVWMSIHKQTTVYFVQPSGIRLYKVAVHRRPTHTTRKVDFWFPCTETLIFLKFHSYQSTTLLVCSHRPSNTTSAIFCSTLSRAWNVEPDLIQVPPTRQKTCLPDELCQEWLWNQATLCCATELSKGTAYFWKKTTQLQRSHPHRPAV